MEQIYTVIIRIFSGCILSFFAFVPGYLIFHMVIGIYKEPTNVEWQIYLFFIFCIALFYFLSLLAYRAFTGKGRKKDGGLLPPWAIILFSSTFGIYKEELRPIVGGISYLFISLAGMRVAKERITNKKKA